MSTDNFVKTYDDCLSEDTCNEYIKQFELAKAASITKEHVPNVDRKDTSFLLVDLDQKLNDSFNEMLNLYVNKYSDSYPILKQYPLVSFHNKMQQTDFGGGYHLWHSENNNVMSWSRALTWLFYFNDVEDGGETELLYQHMRVKPKAGRLVIFPAYFTHTHRGNPPISNTKYIATGWYHFRE